jgi:hypothetical protein
VLEDATLSAEYLDIAKIRGRLDDYIGGTAKTSYYTDLFRWCILEPWMRHAFGSSSAYDLDPAISD